MCGMVTSFLMEEVLSFYWFGHVPHDDELIVELMNIPNTICEVLDITEENNEHYEVYLEFCYPAPIPCRQGDWEPLDVSKW